MSIYIWTTQSIRNLPSEYQEVEYIENSGTQYIDTGVAIPNHKAIAHLEYTSLSSWMYLGCYLGPDSGVSGGHARLYGGYAGTTGQRCYGFLGSYSESGGSVSTNTKYELEVSTISGNMYFKHDGTTFGSSSTTYSTSNAGNFGILGQYNNTSTWQAQVWEARNSARIYDYKIYDSSDVLVRDFVPCYRKLDDVIGMYDLVNDVFYTNSGTGTFTKGADVVPEKQNEINNLYVGEYVEPIVWNGDITQATLSSTTSTTGYLLYGIALSDNGTKLYHQENTGNRKQAKFYQYDLSTPRDVSTKSNPQTFNFGSASAERGVYPFNILFKDGGKKLYILYVNSAYPFYCEYYTLSTAWDITTATLAGTFNLGSIDIAGIYISDDGWECWVFANQGVYYKHLTTQREPEVGTVIGSDYPNGFTFVSTDGNYVYADSGTTITQYSTAGSFDFSSLTQVATFTKPTGSYGQGTCFDLEGNTMYTMRGPLNSQNIYTYSLA